MPEWFTYAKARASFAQVGNDMDAYQLYIIHIVLVQTLMAIQLPDKEKPNTMQMYAAS